jgi:hypothetical protein
MYCGLFVASPAILVLGVFGYNMMVCSQLALECTRRRVYALAVFVGVFCGLAIGIVAFIALAVLCVLMPPVGIAFFFIKISFVLKRRCKYEKKWEHYPRTLV